MEKQVIFEPKITLRKLDQGLFLTLECPLGVNRNPAFTLLRIPDGFRSITFEVSDFESSERSGFHDEKLLTGTVDLLIDAQCVKTLPLNFHLKNGNPRNKEETQYDTDLLWGGLREAINLKSYVQGQMANALGQAFDRLRKAPRT